MNTEASTIPRPEYPRPQFVRTDWLCLNGAWEFETDPTDDGLARGLISRKLAGHITVPFCMESPLSGVGKTDFMNAVWYRREIAIPQDWAGRRVLFHIQAVDYDATVWVNGREAGRHRGGFTPFTVDLGPAESLGGSAIVVVRARDDRSRPQPRGKQSPKPENFGCMYTRTTGIWQTVWMEPVPDTRLLRPRLTPDVANGMIRLEQAVAGAHHGLVLSAVLKDKSGVVASARTAVQDLSPRLDLKIPEDRRRLWGPGEPNLYDLEIELADTEGRVVDRATSYAGLRAITVNGPAILINGEPIFQRLVLDQGYYPDGILTAPTDAALKHDIELSLAAGFNGARLHQKVFEERFLYHADRLGYLVWGEFPDWGAGDNGPAEDHQRMRAEYLTQWIEELERDYSHPAIVGWCPLNETWQDYGDRITDLDDATRGMFLAAKAMDGTRPVLDTSGYSHRVPEADVYDSHDYDQDPASFKARHDALSLGRPFVNTGDKGQKWSVEWRGQPYFVSEYGGIWWNPDAKPGEDSWGYGQRPKTLEEVYARFQGLTDALLDNPHMFGYCYTQLTDVYQEQNGIYRFNREEKYDTERIRKIQQRKAAIER
jgi:beta-galactosidase/beta-glucuronidase